MSEIKSHIPLEGAVNARHLGGCAGYGGRMTSPDAFIRCESPVNLTRSDIDFLIGRGVKTVIDLREDWEAAQEPSPFENRDDVKTLRLPPLRPENAPHLFRSVDMGRMYVHMLEDGKQAFARILRVILEADGCVLFHCSAGKDRTGVLAALLLLNAGVSEEAVTEEYAYTRVLLAPWVRKLTGLLRKRGEPVNERAFDADPDYIRAAIRHINEVYDGIGGYLASAGLEEHETAALRERVLG